MTPQEQITELKAKLKAKGFMVKVSHRRPVIFTDPKTGRQYVLPLETRQSLEQGRAVGLSIAFAPKGGETEVQILHPSKDEIYMGVAVCSRRDNFNKRLGVQIALGRALKAMEKKPVTWVRPGVWAYAP